jgi:hypothetical protein
LLACALSAVLTSPLVSNDIFAAMAMFDKTQVAAYIAEIEKYDKWFSTSKYDVDQYKTWLSEVKKETEHSEVRTFFLWLILSRGNAVLQTPYAVEV